MQSFRITAVASKIAAEYAARVTRDRAAFSFLQHRSASSSPLLAAPLKPACRHIAAQRRCAISPSSVIDHDQLTTLHSHSILSPVISLSIQGL
jgi:hypothetical protein